MHHWRAGEEVSGHRPPVGEILRLLEGHGAEKLKFILIRGSQAERWLLARSACML
jgi:hypothetical protein